MYALQLTFIWFELHRKFLGLHRVLQHACVVHHGHLTVQCGLAWLLALVLQNDLEVGIGAHARPLAFHTHLHAHVIRHCRGIHIWLGAIATGGLYGDPLFFRAWKKRQEVCIKMIFTM